MREQLKVSSSTKTEPGAVAVRATLTYNRRVRSGRQVRKWAVQARVKEGGMSKV